MTLSRADEAAALDKTCAMTSQKGGVAKTTTTAQYAAILANCGLAVLVVDADTSRGMTTLTGTTPTGDAPYSIADLIKGDTDAADCVHTAAAAWQPDTGRPWSHGGALTDSGRIDVVPSPGRALQAMADEKPPAAHLRLLKGLHETGLSAEYDAVLIDCPPSSGAMTELAILAAGWTIFPAHPEMLGTVGFADGVNAVQNFAEAWRHSLGVAGVVLTKVNRTNEHRIGSTETIGWVGQQWPDSGFDDGDPRAEFASAVWAPPIPEAAFVPAANARGESVLSGLPQMYTAAGEAKFSADRQLRLVSGYMRHTLNLLALLVPGRYEDTIAALRDTEIPDQMRQILFDDPLRLEPVAEATEGGQ